jgi:hypothetical protein
MRCFLGYLAEEGGELGHLLVKPTWKVLLGKSWYGAKTDRREAECGEEGRHKTVAKTLR